MKPEKHIPLALRLDIANECLRRGTQAVPLTPKAFAVLRYLVEHPGRLVTKEELHGRAIAKLARVSRHHSTNSVDQ